MKDECEFLRKVELVINRQGPRPDDPAVAPPAGGSSDRVMDRRAFISGATLGLLAAPLLAAEAQQAKTNRIGVLTVSSTEPFRQNLRQLGYVEGQNIVFDVRETQGSPELLDEFALELARLKVDVIVANYPAAVFSARRASATIPIVMVNTPDPVDLGLVASLAHPGGNITGVTSLSVDVSLKQLDLLKEAVPRASRIAELWNPDNPWHPITVKGLEGRSRSLGLQLQFLPVRGPAEFDKTYQEILTKRAQAVLVLADPMTFAHRRQLANLAVKHGLPTMGSLRDYAEAGYLLSYWADGTDLVRRAASYVDRILKGAKPADLPVEQPTKFELIINLKTAKALGLTIPPSLLQRADQVIE
jgi:putative tryptophan/tyrosine transport system substrate-binding protein